MLERIANDQSSHLLQNQGTPSPVPPRLINPASSAASFVFMAQIHSTNHVACIEINNIPFHVKPTLAQIRSETVRQGKLLHF